MEKQKYNSQILNEYLLGSLPETEAEKFDELSFTDEEFADYLKAVENDLIDSYLQNELGNETLQKFRSYYLASPLRREKVNFAKNFQTFAERNRVDEVKENSVVKELKSDENSAGFFSKFNIFPVLRWGFAAFALILILLAGFWFVKNISNRRANEIVTERETNTQNQTPAVQPANQNLKTASEPAANTNGNINVAPAQQTPATETLPKTQSPSEKSSPSQKQPPAKPTFAFFVLAPPVRGAEQIQNLSIPKQTGDIAIQLQLESADYDIYQVALTNQSGDKNIWTSGKLKTNSRGENKFLNIRFPAKLLKSQIYSLAVSGIAPNGEAEIIGNYSFRSVLK